MSKAGKVVLGIATILPLLYIFFFIGFIFANIIPSVAISHQPPATMPAWFPIIFILHLVSMLWIFALLTIYIINLFKNEKVPKDKKTLWAVVLFLGNMFAMPVYWYIYIWRDKA